MAFPGITDVDFSKEPDKVKEMLDYAVSKYNLRQEKIERFRKLYNAYNGYIDQNEIDSIVKSTGTRSKTKYVKYRLGRSKLKQLHGEFLEINLTPTVFTVNPEAQNEKMKRYKDILGMALAKPYIEAVRQAGFDVFKGYNIPDIESPDFWSVDNFKLANELIMQDIVIDKLNNEHLKGTFYQDWIDLTITAEAHAKIERDQNGVDTLRFIPADLALYEEEVFDPLLKRSPYRGEVRKMYLHEILANPEFKLSPEDKAKIKANQSYQHDTNDSEGHRETRGSHPVNKVYTIQWKGLEPVRIKTAPAKGSEVPYKMILSEEYYQNNKRKINKEVRNGLYKIESYYQEIVWTASRINDDIYTVAKKEEDIIQRLQKNGKLTADYDYVSLLFSTVDGTRVSLQEIVYELERIYDDIRFQINKELRKIRGSALIYDKAFLPKGKLFHEVIHDISEDGVVTYDSSAEGNVAGMEVESDKVGIKSIDLGEHQSLVVLLNQAIDIERVMDRITGMNENRQGLAKATSTATANVNNIEASRSITYDLFYFMNMFIEEALVKLVEKTKLNKTYFGQDQRRFIFDQNQIAFMMTTRDIDKDNYGVRITDGKRERDILQKLELMFPQEINAGMLATKDVAKFMMESNFTRALKVLDQARDRLEKFQQEQARVGQEAKKQEIQTNYQMAQEDREDKQSHDKDMEVLRTEGKKEVAYIQGSIKGKQDSQKQSADMIQKDRQDRGL